MNFLKTSLLSTVLVSIGASQAFAQTQTNRQLDSIGAPIGTEALPSAGGAVFDVLPIVGIFWDERCASVEYTFNTNVGANPGTSNEISANLLANIVQRGLNRWNDNPSAYIEMNITNRTDLGPQPRVGGNFINEVTFITDPTFGALASSPSTSLAADTTFVAGEDLDFDGDSDVFDPAVEGINVCSDVDGDGDFEFPAGDYLAGTILDNDVQFSSTVLWETIPTVGGGADVDAVSTHEFGHSHGLSHSFINQISRVNGTTSTMFPFISTDIPAAEIGTRSPHVDDLAASAYIYQEGNGTTPISDIQPGDIAFDQAYALVTGSVSDAAGNPIAGAAVSVARQPLGRVDSVVYSGETVAFGDGSGGAFVFPEGVRNGDFAIPAPVGETYVSNIEALDGLPAAAGNISLNAIIADILGQTSFPEEGFNIGDRGVEIRPNEAQPFVLPATGRPRIDYVLNTETIQRNAGPGNSLSGNIIGASSIRYVEQFDRDEILTRFSNGDVLIGGGADAFLFAETDSTLTFSRAAIGLGRVQNDGTVFLARVIGETGAILADDNDLTPITFGGANQNLRFEIAEALNMFPTAEVFMILDIDNVQTGPNSGFPIGFLLNDTTQAGTSFLSINNGPINPVPFTWTMQLHYVNDGRPVPPELQ